MDEMQADQKERRLISVTQDQLRAVMRETVEETLTKLGVDYDDPLEMQRDFQHLRDTRQARENFQKKGSLTLLGILISGFLGATWLGFKELIKNGGS